MRIFRLQNILFLTAVIMTPAALHAQFGLTREGPAVVQDRVKFDLLAEQVPSVNSDTVNVRVYIKISNDIIQFVLHDSVYKAEYDINLAVKKGRSAISSRVLRDRSSTSSYSETIAPGISRVLHENFTLLPGKYQLQIELLDTETSQPLRQIVRLEVMDFRSALFFAASPLFYSAASDSLLSGKSGLPVFPPVRTPSDSLFHAGYVVFTEQPGSMLHVHNVILNAKGEIISQDSADVPLRLKSQRLFFPVNLPMDFGTYKLVTRFSSGSHIQTLETLFHVRWDHHPAFLSDLDQSVEVLLYIMERPEYNRLLKLEPEDQKKMLDEFWAERDPDPSTPDNELEAEYYRRVAYVNAVYSSYGDGSDGWRTDRGKVYILYGPPSNIDTMPFHDYRDSRYEIWFYSHIKKRFVFIDKFGMGEFRLYSEQ